jgi:K+-transporting ATPase ATPase A chain
MNTEILGVILMFVTTILMAVPLGKYIGKVYSGHSTWLDRFFLPIDRLIFKFIGVNTEK